MSQHCRGAVTDSLDPFASHFHDDAASGDEGAAPEPLDDEERGALLEDLEDLSAFRAVLEPRGVRGVTMPCPDCEEDHFFDWDLLRDSLEHILEHGEPRVHEPACEPRPEEYVTWDYAKGFVDATLEDEEPHQDQDGWASPAETARRVHAALEARGLRDSDIARVLQAGGLPLPSEH